MAMISGLKKLYELCILKILNKKIKNKQMLMNSKIGFIEKLANITNLDDLMN